MANARDPVATPADDTLHMPTGATPSREALGIAQAEIAAAADYGPAPADWFLAPRYAWRVNVRQRALQAKVKQLDAELGQAERERDERLADFVVALRPKLEAESRWFRLLEAVHAAEDTARQRSDRLARTNAAYGAELAKIEKRRGELEGSIAEKRVVDQERQRELAGKDHELKRVEGQLKRVQIEIRNASQLAEQAAVGGSGVVLPADHHQRQAELEQQAGHLGRSAEELRAQVQAARFDADLARGELEDLGKEGTRVDKQRKELDGRYGDELGSRTVTVADAQRIERQALADAGRGLLAERDANLLDARTLSALRSCDDKVRLSARALQVHLAALDSFDEDARRRGTTMAAAALVGLVVFVCAIVMFA